MIRFSNDTRTIRPGDYYVAIRGERYDGHDFILEAISKGAAGLVVERSFSDLSIPPNIDVREVTDSILFLASEARQRIIELRPDVIAITGSVGKTTTKNAVATVLSHAFPVVKPEGNLNTLLGLSLAILNELRERNQKLVVEIGTYQRGNIAHLCSFIPPLVSVVTNVFPVHLERMKTIEEIALAKGELVEALPVAGTACLNWDDPLVQSMAARCRGKVLAYGIQPGAAISPERITADIPLLGTYRMHTALAAYSVAHCFGLPQDLINQGLCTIRAEKGRLSKLPGVNGTTLLDDTYNASPVSTLAALEVLRRQAARRRIVFLGDMLELGPEEEGAHSEVLRRAVEVADKIVLVGPRMSIALQNSGVAEPKQLSVHISSGDVVDALRAGQVYTPRKGDWILVKGSAGMRMERIVRFLLSPELDPRLVLVRQEAGWQSL